MKVEDKKLFTVKDCNELTNKQVRELYKKYVSQIIMKLKL